MHTRCGAAACTWGSKTVDRSWFPSFPNVGTETSSLAAGTVPTKPSYLLKKRCSKGGVNMYNGA